MKGYGVDAPPESLDEQIKYSRIRIKGYIAGGYFLLAQKEQEELGTLLDLRRKERGTYVYTITDEPCVDGCCKATIYRTNPDGEHGIVCHAADLADAQAKATTYVEDRERSGYDARYEVVRTMYDAHPDDFEDWGPFEDSPHENETDETDDPAHPDYFGGYR